MPALVKPPATLPRFAPHANNGTPAGAGLFPGLQSNLKPQTPHPPVAEETGALAHDARNMLSGLMLYCELLAGKGVLSEGHSHYAQELETIVQSTSQIVERMAAAHSTTAARNRPQGRPIPHATISRSVAVTDLAADLRHLQPLLAAIAGPAIRLSIATMPCAGRLGIAVEDLTRVLVNLVRNAADAMTNGGHIRVTAQFADGFSLLDAIGKFPSQSSLSSQPRKVLLTVIDNGPGIPEPLRAQVFDLGFTTRDIREQHSNCPPRRGTGLTIVRNLVEAAGGAVRATSAPSGGACFEIALPLEKALLPIRVSRPQTAHSC